jgi:hypothetical protein
MQGALGIGANRNKFSAAVITEAAKMVATYNRIRPAANTPRCSCSGTRRTSAPAIRLQGLDPRAIYRAIRRP